MEELFDNIFVLVPVALIVFLRVFGEGARKRAEKVKKPASTAVPADPVTPAVQAPSESERRPWNFNTKVVTREKARTQDRKPRPARRDLMGRLKNYFSGSLDQATEEPQPLHFEEEAARRLGQYRPQPAVYPVTRPQVTSGYKEGLPGAMEESPAITREPVARYSFPDRLGRLTALKRAIVLSEVLGKPKSLQ